MQSAPKLTLPALEPFALKDAPSLIERVFPAQKISAEAQKERKAGAGQTLTALGSYWKGRKPLIMVRAIVLGCLLPVTDDLEADLHIFELLMAIDDAAFGRRAPKLKPAEVAERVTIKDPWDYFDYTIKNRGYDAADIESLHFPLNLAEYPALTLRWKRNLDPEKKYALLAQAIAGMAYEEKVGLCRRPEELDPAVLYGPIWPEVNAHLARFGIEAHSHEQLVEQLGILRYGHRPRVGDTFCGGGSIPFEAARLGCDVYASDLNPVACMLTWGNFHIIGAAKERREYLEKLEYETLESAQEEIKRLGIERTSNGWSPKVFLYCIEVRCRESGWMVPLLPSFIISKPRSGSKNNVIAQLSPNHASKTYNIDICSHVSDEELEKAELGSLRTDGKGQDPYLFHVIDGIEYRTKISTLRGDYRKEDGSTANALRLWERHDSYPLSEDLLQERLYCIEWLNDRGEYEFRSVTQEDLDREDLVKKLVDRHLSDWQEQGLVPDMAIEPGAKTDEPIRTRGWRYWHQLFNARQLLIAVLFQQLDDPVLKFGLTRILNANSRLSRWDAVSGGGGCVQAVFDNQALNPLFNYGCRGYKNSSELFAKELKSFNLSSAFSLKIDAIPAADVKDCCEIWITDPPYADAINYHEITEFFIAWLRKNPPPPFDQWIWDSRRALAIKGDGEDFRRGMVNAYTAMANHMPDNGLQCVMFTHQDTGVWADMVSIFWAAGLQVVSAWYIATETTSELKQGGYVQGTVTLLLRKRLGTASTFKQRLLPQIRKEVTAQIEAMMNLNDTAGVHGETVFNDSDLQMAGYAAALKVLTQYTEVDGRDVTTLALQPRQRGQSTVVDDIVEYAAEVANNLLIPERLKELNPDTWSELTGVERFYLRMAAIEKTGATKLDNYQNFAKAFHVAYQPLMASVKPNKARLKGVREFKPRELTSGDLAGTLLSELFMAIQELLDDKDPKVVIGQIRTSLGDTYFAKRNHLVAMAHYLGEMWAEKHPNAAQKAEIIGSRIRNEGI